MVDQVVTGVYKGTESRARDGGGAGELKASN
jgi:hypothetical protein